VRYALKTPNLAYLRRFLVFRGTPPLGFCKNGNMEVIIKMRLKLESMV